MNGGISREEVNQMKNLLKIIGSNSDEGKRQPQYHQPQPLPLMENYDYDDESQIDLSAFGFPSRQQPQPQRQARQPQREQRVPPRSNGYSITESYKTVSGLKKSDFYDIVTDDDAIFKNLALKESAKAIIYLLDKGFTHNHPRIQEILDLDEKYFQGLKEYMINKTRHKKLSESGDNKAARIFATKMDETKTIVLQTKDKLTMLSNNF